MSFVDEMRSVLDRQQSDEADKDVNLPTSNANESLDRTHETLVLDEELIESEFVADTVNSSFLKSKLTLFLEVGRGCCY